MLDNQQTTPEEIEGSNANLGVDPDEDKRIIKPFDPELIRVETRPMTIDL